MWDEVSFKHITTIPIKVVDLGRDQDGGVGGVLAPLLMAREQTCDGSPNPLPSTPPSYNIRKLFTKYSWKYKLQVFTFTF